MGIRAILSEVSCSVIFMSALVRVALQLARVLWKQHSMAWLEAWEVAWLCLPFLPVVMCSATGLVTVPEEVEVTISKADKVHALWFLCSQAVVEGRWQGGPWVTDAQRGGSAVLHQTTLVHALGRHVCVCLGITCPQPRAVKIAAAERIEARESQRPCLHCSIWRKVTLKSP